MNQHYSWSEQKLYAKKQKKKSAKTTMSRSLFAVVSRRPRWKERSLAVIYETNLNTMKNFHIYSRRPSRSYICAKNIWKMDTPTENLNDVTNALTFSHKTFRNYFESDAIENSKSAPPAFSIIKNTFEFRKGTSDSTWRINFAENPPKRTLSR